ncbi:MAG: MFS transporter, partial [Muribaculaceae bacterium]
IANWNTQYLVDHFEAIGQQADATTIAGAVVGVYWLLMLVGRLVGGIVGGMVSSRAMLTTTSALLAVLVSAAICVSGTNVPFISFSSADMSIQTVQVPLNAILLVLCGLCTSVMWGAIFNLAVEGLGRFTSLASGLFMVMVCGGGILPFLQGYVSTNILSTFWLIAGLGIYLLIYALLLSKPDKEAQKEKGAFA